MGIFSKNDESKQEVTSVSQEDQSMENDNSNNQVSKPNQVQGNEQAPMPNESTGSVKEIDGKKYHFSNAEETHVIPEVTAEELDKKTQQAPKEVNEQKANVKGAPENK